jgi:hypothetical protein
VEFVHSAIAVFVNVTVALVAFGMDAPLQFPEIGPHISAGCWPRPCLPLGANRRGNQGKNKNDSKRKNKGFATSKTVITKHRYIFA